MYMIKKKKVCYLSVIEKCFVFIQYESSLSKLPVHGHRGEKERLEAELDQLDKELGSVRMSLKRFHVLKSTIWSALCMFIRVTNCTLWLIQLCQQVHFGILLLCFTKSYVVKSFWWLCCWFLLSLPYSVKTHVVLTANCHLKCSPVDSKE